MSHDFVSFIVDDNVYVKPYDGGNDHQREDSEKKDEGEEKKEEENEKVEEKVEMEEKEEEKSDGK